MESELTRQGKEGERLHTQRFGYHEVVGLASRGRPDVAVCLLPGSVLRLSSIPREVQSAHAVQSEEVVQFVKMTTAAKAFRDGVRFSNGSVVSMQDLFGASVLIEDIIVPDPKGNTATTKLAKAMRHAPAAMVAATALLLLTVII